MSEPKKITAYILAGGKSSRMGTDKGLLNLNGKPMINYVIDELTQVAKNLVIVSNNQEYERFGYEVIPDEIKQLGPAGGIYTALRHSKTTANFITSCDMPFIRSAAIKHIISASGNYEITVPIYRGKVEPMLGVYSTFCATNWGAILNSGTYKLVDIFSHFNTHYENADENPLFSDRLFTNINTLGEINSVTQNFKNGN